MDALQNKLANLQKSLQKNTSDAPTRRMGRPSKMGTGTLGKSRNPILPDPKEKTKEPDISELRQIVLGHMKLPEDPEVLIRKAVERIRDEGTEDEEARSLAMKAVFSLGFENDYILAEAVDPKYRSLAIELRRRLIKDFDCKTHAEKVLVDAVVSGYIKGLECTRAFNIGLEHEFLSPVRNQYLSMLSKEMDRANRQALTALQTLVSLKRPPLNVQVKANAAFIAQTQQVNLAEKPQGGESKANDPQ